ncbi:MAG: hypothetical protein KAR20_18520, partial [Candidatus Heimdallarchaeota archaeon]|nr:hypothetical protein [Candidatus Heimdallarchaeota archaeon]
DGLINLDSIVKLAYQDGIIKGQGDIANMIFVNAVDGHKGPLGRGMMGGNITFIVLGEEENKNRQAMETFVIAHELCHNLSLPHIVDDDRIPNNIPNIMGDGAFSERIDPEYSLVPLQIEQIIHSPLVRPRIDLLNEELGREAIIDETFEAYFSNLQKVETAAFTAQEVLFDELPDIREFARKQFAEAVSSFSEDEQEAMEWIINEVNHTLIKNGFYRFAAHPWRIIKTENWLCGGFAYTRGNFIILSQRHVERVAKTFNSEISIVEKNIFKARMASLLVHEQMHCLQRTFPSMFEELYSEWGLVKAIVKDHPEITKLQVSNPDAPITNWLIPKNKKKFYWI